jgi:hypothetical protein
MKMIRNLTIVLAGLVLANGLLAGGPGFAHTHPWFKTAKTNYTFTDGSTVEWEVKWNSDPQTQKFDTVVYTVTITPKTPAGEAYSMLTLGLQAVGHDLFILSSKDYLADGTTPSAQFAKPGQASASAPAQYPLFVPRAGIKIDQANPKLEAVNPDGVWFIAFKGAKCELTVIAANRKRVGLTRWEGGNYGEGHDTTPPPSDPN